MLTLVLVQGRELLECEIISLNLRLYETQSTTIRDTSFLFSPIPSIHPTSLTTKFSDQFFQKCLLHWKLVSRLPSSLLEGVSSKPRFRTGHSIPFSSLWSLRFHLTWSLLYRRPLQTLLHPENSQEILEYL